MNKALWMAGQWANQIGVAGVAGIAMLVFWLAFHFSAVVPAELRLAELQREAHALQEQRRLSSRQPDAEQESPAAQLARFYRFFPAHGSAPDWLEIVYAAAQAQDLKLERGEYRVAREKAGKLTRLQVILPVRGSYVQIRKFLAATLSEVPVASLDGVRFERQKILDGSVEAQIKLTLYLG